jgi:hypothetical protein
VRAVPIGFEEDAVFVDALDETDEPALLFPLSVSRACQQLLGAFVADALFLGLGLLPSRRPAHL